MSTCLCLPKTGVESVYHHALPLFEPELNPCWGQQLQESENRLGCEVRDDAESVDGTNKVVTKIKAHRPLLTGREVCVCVYSGTRH